ncbi:MAG: class F sortase [Candidatus Saccharibacteria bacterium]|nr:class F sortase [Candidatus Saccharibacteria bacterium]
MKLKHRWDPKVVFTVLYFVCFVAYLVVNLRTVEAKAYDVATNLIIPSIGLSADVTELTLVDGELETPDTIVGSFRRADNKTLLIGHSSTVFQELNKVEIGDKIFYDGTIYYIVSAETLEKAAVDMGGILAKASRQTIVVMTCAGQDLGGGDATHRLIVTAIRK